MTRKLGGIAVIVLFSGCGGSQSALAPAGPQAGLIGQLFWLNLGVVTCIYASVLLTIAAALVMKSRPRRMPPLLAPPVATERRITRAVGAAIVGSGAILLALLIADYGTGRAVRAMADPEALTIKVTGHQWWWEFQYQDSNPSRMVTTANEIHIPVGRTVQVLLQSTDVIHSFWVPNLLGKRDLVPGHPTRAYFRADRAGTFGGQCAEFCGLQHAFMRFVVVAESEEEFQDWMERQRQSAPEPKTEGERRGRRVFMGSRCVTCHTIGGTESRATVGPDLTHVASRPLVGGALPMSRGNLGGWVVDPQRIKPGVRMPMNPIKPDDLGPLLDYLESLK